MTGVPAVSLHRSAAAWMTDARSLRLFAALSTPDQPARFVGGAVRDWLMDRPVGDIDIATPLTPELVMTRLDAAGIRTLPTGIDHGTVTAVIDHRAYEITTLRRDVATDGRHAIVAFAADWAADAARRDFTINALFADADGTVYDPVGGLADLAIGRVRFIGDADRRIAEDHLRLLRFFRFHAQLGRAAPLAADLAACTRHAQSLRDLSVERIWAEFKKLLAAPDPVLALTWMQDGSVLAEIAPEAGHDLTELSALIGLERVRQVNPSALRRLAGLIDHANAAALADRLKLSGAERDTLAALTTITETAAKLIDAPWSALRRFGAALVRDSALIAAARGLTRALTLADQADAWVDRPFPISGADVLALGVPPGPEIGRLLGIVEIWWEGGGCIADRAACLAQLRQVGGRS